MSNLRTLAETLGLSITTVSRALDGYPEVAEATRLRVRAAADAAGYRPNASARRLRKQRTELCVVPLPSHEGRIGAPHLLDILAGCATRLSAAGLGLIMAPVSAGEDETVLLRRMIDGGRADAVLLFRTRLHDPRVAFLQERGVPFVTSGRTLSSRPHAFIDGDGFAAFRDAVHRLAGLGRRRIAHIHPDPEFFFARDRRAGWLAGLDDLGLPPGGDALAPMTEEGGFTATRRLLSAEDPPDALLCATDEMAIGALGALRQAGRGDVAVIGHDDLTSAPYADPPLSSMRLDAPHLGQRFADLLLGVLAGKPPAELQEVHPVEFVARESHLRGPLSRPGGAHPVAAPPARSLEEE